MAQRVTVQMVDDLDGTAADDVSTVSFALDGVSYEIDLSEANAEDPRLPDSVGMNETPVRLSTLRRENSDPDVRKQLEKTKTANTGKTRSFIRTWVRIIPANSTELDGL
ncbi:histone-like nucleoid-structuring protein Lsr2 [Kibdelosporangium lantanae]|uniref:Histone-like nucleoid-structuring protein Lsr2 n=1 Tax=Kibdelosporangium lantanae TaxID=1497396 RepID=A0ABW3M8C2_9PSEU